MGTTVVSITPGKTMSADGIERKLDNELLIIAILSHKIQPLRIEASGRLICFVFDGRETEAIENKILANQPLPIDFQDVILAMALWKNAITLAKSKSSDPIVG